MDSHLLHGHDDEGGYGHEGSKNVSNPNAIRNLVIGLILATIIVVIIATVFIYWQLTPASPPPSQLPFYFAFLHNTPTD